ncbi:elongation factor 2-like [Vitis riparia]|uniref:elongation factor 2-like n=1 Tax=Vitis riparia TaxID=96939 RepID=UPI00155A1E07|nr:elongation factor 2-like [Vitis riparia]
MKFSVSPGVHIVIQCKVASGLPQLVEGSKCLAKSDPMGLRHKFMGNAEIVRFDLVASSRETVFEKPCKAMISRWVLKARPEILSEEFICGKNLAKKIWCSGTGTTDPNMVVDMCKGARHFDEIKNSVAAESRWLTKAGVLAEEEHERHLL